MSANIDLFTRAAIRDHNFEAVPRNLTLIIESIDVNKSAKPFIELFSLPHTRASSEAFQYAKLQLSTSVMNHSLRMYHFGLSIAGNFFPTWNLNQETWLLVCLLHDIGSIQSNRSNTLLSTEFKSGILSHALTTSWGSPSEQCDAIAEAIIRQRDVDQIGKGKMTRLGAMLQITILYDNTGRFANLINDATLETVLLNFPRLKWDMIIAESISFECDTKPWCQTTKIGRREYLLLIEGTSNRAVGQ